MRLTFARMALIYPVQADAPESDDDAAPDFEELAADVARTMQLLGVRSVAELTSDRVRLRP